MRAIIYKRGGYDLGVIGETGGETSGEVFLFRDPVELQEASTKSYTDNKLASLVTSSFTQGTIDPLHLPAFSGAIVKGAGSSVLTAPDSGVTVGTYTKVLVNNKGIVYNSATLVESDIPELDWSKLTTDKPTTLSGYGIVNGLPLTGGTMTGTLKIDTVINDPQALANKEFTDSEGSSGLSVNTGGIVYRVSSTASTGFLRCNGAAISTSMYPGLYTAIGDEYSIISQPGNGVPWKQQNFFNFTQTNDITGWSSGTALPAANGGAQTIVTNSRVYLLGGIDGTSATTAVVRTAVLNTNGTLGSWTTGTALPAPLCRSQAVVTKNRVYLLGGLSDGSYVSTVYTAPINTDGTLGAWTTGPSLPVPIGEGFAFVVKDRMYYCGGYVNAAGFSTAIYANTINADGTINSWSVYGNLPNILMRTCYVITKNRIHVLGGVGSGGSITNKTLTAPINGDGTLGAWTSGALLPIEVCWSEAVAVRDKVYLLGGCLTSDAATNAVYYASVNEDGTLGSWTAGTNMSASIYSHSVIVTNSKIYTIGGVTTNYSTVVRLANFSGGLNDYSPYYDGSISLTPNGQFNLPDITSRLPSTYAYIKY